MCVLEFYVCVKHPFTYSHNFFVYLGEVLVLDSVLLMF